YLANFMATAAWGYVACIAGAALAMEHSYVRVREHWHALGHAIARAVSADADPVTAQPTARIGGPTTEATADQGLSARAQPSDRTENPPVGPTAMPEPVPAPAAQEPAATPPPRPGTPEVDVIVGPGEVRRVSIEEIQAQPERYVRDTSGRQWFLRQYY